MSEHLVQRNLHLEVLRKGTKSPGPRSQLYQHHWKLPSGRAALWCDPWPSGDGDLPEPDLQLAQAGILSHTYSWDRDPEINVATRPTCLTASSTVPPCCFMSNFSLLCHSSLHIQVEKNQIHVFTSTIPDTPIYLIGSECQGSQYFFSLRLEVS